MTLKSTYRILYKARETGKLVRRLPFRSRGPSIRELHVAPEVHSALDGNNPFHDLPMVETENLIALFDAGHLISASLIGNNKKRPDAERMRDLDEVWALCIRRPRAFQFRILGRFLDRNVFVGLAAYERWLLGRTANYNELASDVPKLWKQAVGDVEPLRADAVEEYLVD